MLTRLTLMDFEWDFRDSDTAELRNENENIKITITKEDLKDLFESWRENEEE